MISPAARARVRELHAAGLSLRAICEAMAREGVKLGPSTAHYIVKPEQASKAKARAVVKLREDPGPDAAPHEIVRFRLYEVRDVITKLQGQVALGDYPPDRWSVLVRIELDLARTVSALEALATKGADPSADPWNVGARTLILDTVRHNMTAIQSRRPKELQP